MITITSLSSSFRSNLSLQSTQSPVSAPGPYFRHGVLILGPSGRFDLQTHYSVLMKVNTNASLTVSQGVLPCAGLFSPTGGGVSAQSASQRTRHRRRWPWGVFSATRTPGGQSEVQNHQRQEGHGQRHVSHLLPSPGERRRQEGEKGQGAETLLNNSSRIYRSKHLWSIKHCINTCQWKVLLRHICFLSAEHCAYKIFGADCFVVSSCVNTHVVCL